MPVLIAHGSRDPIAAPDRVHGLSGARLEVKVFDGLLHDLLHESRAHEVVNHVSAWLERVLPR
jgi:alpha-beta hydrolase superfamily lysophospholipase